MASRALEQLMAAVEHIAPELALAKESSAHFGR